MSDLTWNEQYLIIALRTLKWRMQARGYYVSGLDYNSRDGDFIEFYNRSDKKSVLFQYNPGFDVIVKEKKILGGVHEIRLVLKKNSETRFKALPMDFKGPDGLESILIAYLELLEAEYLK